jgi:hypothetical protein
MDLDRGTLARLDRRLLAGHDREERFQMVRVPVTPATWSTWKRYCTTVGTSMGRAIAVLIEHELTSALGAPGREAASLLATRVQDRLAEREAELASRKAELEIDEERLRRWSDHLGDRERYIEVRDWQLEVATKLTVQPGEVGEKAGRNERCPCGSGLKYKRCHGLLGGATSRASDSYGV